ncbi:MAG: NUDIX hydrolase [Candidatus Omnitrophota bacterium]
MKKNKKEISAGGVVLKKDDQGLIYVIIYCRNNGRQWCLPKGKIEKNETIEQTALREVREETGITGKIICALPDICYQYQGKHSGVIFDKTVYFFLMQYESGEINADDYGVEEVKWYNLDQAIAKLSFENEKNVLKRAKQIIINNK